MASFVEMSPIEKNNPAAIPSAKRDLDQLSPEQDEHDRDSGRGTEPEQDRRFRAETVFATSSGGCYPKRHLAEDREEHASQLVTAEPASRQPS